MVFCIKLKANISKQLIYSNFKDFCANINFKIDFLLFLLLSTAWIIDATNEQSKHGSERTKHKEIDTYSNCDIDKCKIYQRNYHF